MNDNAIIHNRIYGNGPDTGDAATSGPAGINLFSLVPVTGTVVSHNWFDDEAIDMVFNAPSGQINAHLNNFDMKGIGVDNVGTGTVNAIFNWWNCPGGPSGGKRCASVVGSGVVFTPWLTALFDTDHH